MAKGQPKELSSPPITQSEWDSHLKENGQGRATVTTICVCFGVSKGMIERIREDLISRIANTPGMADLVVKCREKTSKGPKDQSKLDRLTREVEKWLMSESEWASFFGGDNTKAPQANKDEAVRKLVFDAKTKLFKTTTEKERRIKEDYGGLSSPASASKTSLSLLQPSLGMGSTPWLPPPPPSPSTGDRPASPIRRSELYAIPADHPLLTEQLPNLMNFNLRLVDSLSKPWRSTLIAHSGG